MLFIVQTGWLGGDWETPAVLAPIYRSRGDGGLGHPTSDAHAHRHARTRTDTHGHTHAHTNAHAHTHTHIHTHTHTHTHTDPDRLAEVRDFCPSCGKVDLVEVAGERSTRRHGPGRAVFPLQAHRSCHQGRETETETETEAERETETERERERYAQTESETLT